MRKLLFIILLALTVRPASAQQSQDKDYLFVYNLRTQYRRLKVHFTEKQDTLTLHWSFTNYVGTKKGTFIMSPQSREHATQICYIMPTNGMDIMVPQHELFALLSRDALNELNANGKCRYNNTTLTLIDTQDNLLHVKDYDEGYEMWIENNPKFPLIRKMLNNPIEIDWEVIHNP